MKNFLISIILASILFGCNVSGGSSTGSPSKVLLTGAKGLYLQSGGSKVVAGPDTLLMKIMPDSSTGPAVFTDSNNIDLEVYINQALLINDDYLFINYTHEGFSTDAEIELSTGYVSTLSSAPENWDRIREKSNRAYYIADGSLCNLDMPTMALKKMNDAISDPLNGSSHIFINNSDNVFTLYMASSSNKKFMLYYDDGSDPVDLSGQVEAERFVGAVSGDMASSDIFAVEDETTRDVYYIRFNASDITSQEITFSDIGTITAGAETVISPIGSGSNYARLGPGRMYFNNSIFTNDTHILKFSHSAGSISVTSYSQSGELQSYSWMPDAKYINGSLYVGYDHITSGLYKIIELDVSGSSSIESALIAEPDISEFVVVEDQVFYAIPAGVYKYDIPSGITEMYSTILSDIQNLTE